MKFLIVGIDGGDTDLIKGLDMPFLQGLISRSDSRELTEDLISRGWAEIISGKHGSSTRALYMRPKLDGTYQFTTSFGVEDLLENEEVTPLWDLVASHGQKIGMMNVPTTGPAPKVEGFLVAGGGGGVDKVDGLSEDLFYPSDARGPLEENRYIVDLRLTSEKIHSFKELVNRLNKIIVARTDSYLALEQKFRPEIGFMCYRVSTVLQYLAMSEIQAIISIRTMPELAAQDRNQEPHLSDIQTLIVDHFRLLDDQIRRIFEALSPHNYVITSDHGAVPYLHHINIDAWLGSAGYQAVPKSKLSLRRLLRKHVLPRISKDLKAKLARKSLGAVSQFGLRFNPRSTKAFSNYYMSGIFVNDQRRFGGPVRGEGEVDDLVDEICQRISADAESKKYGLSGVPYRRHFKGAKFCDFMPDIRLEKPDSSFVTGRGDYVSRNLRYGPLTEDLSEATDMHSGQKGRRPLYYFSHSLRQFDDERYADLTAVYRILENYLKAERGI